MPSLIFLWVGGKRTEIKKQKPIIFKILLVLLNPFWSLVEYEVYSMLNLECVNKCN